MNISLRRKLLIALAGGAAAHPPLSFGHVPYSLPYNKLAGAGAAVTANTLLAQARAWIDGLRKQGQVFVPYPISQLRRTLRIGYTRTCALVELLAELGEWTIGYRPEGGRFARIQP